jgi:signal transduction histidine kinase
MARSFNSMATSLEKAEQSRRQLNADIAHELRTPLTIIQGTVEGIMDGVFKADKEHLETIKHQATLLTRLTQDIRELSLVESGQLKLQPEPTDINTIIQHMISQIKTKGIEKNVTIAFNGDQNLPVIKLDPVRIGQAIANLLTNALHYAPQGSIITVSSKLEINNAISLIDKPAVLISVADSGKGITPEHLPYIFERFYRVDNSRARNEGGTGLGLAIVKQMVEAHGGKVRVESLPGKGSIFYIALPTNDEL